MRGSAEGSVERIRRMRPSRGLSLRVSGNETEKTVAVAAPAGQVTPSMVTAAKIERITVRFRVGIRLPWRDNFGKTRDCSSAVGTWGGHFIFLTPSLTPTLPSDVQYCRGRAGRRYGLCSRAHLVPCLAGTRCGGIADSSAFVALSRDRRIAETARRSGPHVSRAHRAPVSAPDSRELDQLQNQILPRCPPAFLQQNIPSP